MKRCDALGIAHRVRARNVPNIPARRRLCETTVRLVVGRSVRPRRHVLDRSARRRGCASSVLGLRDWLLPSSGSRLVGVPAARIHGEGAPPSARRVRTAALAKRATRLTCRPMPTTKCILCGQRLAPPSLSLITASPDPRLCASCHALPEAERQKLRQAAQVRVLREDENE